MILRNVWEKWSEVGLWHYHRELMYFFFSRYLWKKFRICVYIYVYIKKNGEKSSLPDAWVQRSSNNFKSSDTNVWWNRISFFLTWCFWWNLIKVAFLFVCQHRAWCQSRSVKSFISQLQPLKSRGELNVLWALEDITFSPFDFCYNKTVYGRANLNA